MRSFYQDFRRSVREAIAERRRTRLPRTARLVAAVVTFVALYVSAAIIATPSDQAKELHFEEGGAVTALSANLLAIAGGFAFASFFTARKRTRNSYFWLAASIVLGFLSLDELLEFHETVGDELDAMERFAGGFAAYFRNWNDIIVILYGLIVLPPVIYFLPGVLRYAKVAEILCVAFTFYCVHTFVDATQEPSTTMTTIIEETAKVFCSAFLALAFFVGLMGTIEENDRA